MAQDTPTQRLAQLLLGQSLETFVVSRRPQSWRLIARDLFNATNGQIDVTQETLRLWYGEHASADKAAS